MATALAVRAGERFDPNQPRWPPGTPGGRGGEWLGDGLPDLAGRDGLRLAGRVRLGTGEAFAGSAVVDAGDGTVVPVAAVRTPDGPRLRIGTGILDEDRGRWSAAERGHTVNLAPAGVAELQETLGQLEEVAGDGTRRLGGLSDRADRLAERQRELIRAQHPGLSKTRGQQLDRIDRQIADLESRLDRVDRTIAERVARLPPELQQRYQQADPAEQLRIITDWHDQDPKWRAVGVGGFHARDVQTRARLRAELDAAQARRTEVAGDPVPLPPEQADELARVTVELEQAERAWFDLADSVLAEGAIPGEWADLAYEVSLDEQGRPGYTLAARRHDAPADWTLGDDDTGSQLTAGQLRQLAAEIVRLLDEAATEAWDPGLHPRGPDGRFIRKGVVAALLGAQTGQPPLPFEGLVRGGSRTRPPARAAVPGRPRLAQGAGAEVPRTRTSPPRRAPRPAGDSAARRVPLSDLAGELDALVDRVDGLDESQRAALARRLRAAVAGAEPAAPAPARPRRPRAAVTLPDGLVDRLRAGTSREQVRDLLSGLPVAQLRAVADEMGIAAGPMAKPRLVEHLVQWIIGVKLDSRAIFPGREATEAWNPALHPRGPDGRFIGAGVIGALLGGTAAAGRSAASSARRAARAAAARLRAAADTDEARAALAGLSLVALRALADELPVPGLSFAARSDLIEELVRSVFARREAIDAAEAAGDQLKRFWTKNPEGLAKWATRPHPWTALYRQLVRHMPPARAKRVASAWFKEVFGIWPGERFGDNPAGPG